jgi:DNA-binding protein YbaB
MTYIPKDAQDSIDRLQEELSKAEAERDEAIKKNKSALKAGEGYKSGFWLVLAVLIIGLAYLGFAYTKGYVPFNGEHSQQDLALQSNIDSLQNAMMNLQEEAAQAGVEIDFSQGLWYFVQIGAYEELDLTMYEENMFNFRQREEDGLFKYSLGAFRDAAKAEAFLTNVRKMGIRDAWLLATNNGERISIEESKAL